jgi:ribose transport system permease protein
MSESNSIIKRLRQSKFFPLVLNAALIVASIIVLTVIAFFCGVGDTPSTKLYKIAVNLRIVLPIIWITLVLGRRYERISGLISFAAVFILCVIYSPLQKGTGYPIFLTLKTQLDVLFENADAGILAVGMTLVILTGGIDLSVGSVLGMVSTFFALLVIGLGVSPYIALALSLYLGAAAGAINGTLISRFRLQPFAATLAIMAAARGVAKWMTNQAKVQPGAQDWYAVQGDSPSFFVSLTKSLPVIQIKPVSIIFLVTVIVMWFVVRYTRYGRHLYAIGGNEEAARLSGIRVMRDKFLAYVMCGMFAGLGGVCTATRLELGDPEAGGGYELDAIAAVVIGGTNLNGGRGGMMLTLIGALMIGSINKILSLNGIPEAWRLIAKGGIIVLAVLIQKQKRS